MPPAYGAKNEPLAPALSAYAVTPDDNAQLDNVRALYIGGGGDLKVLMFNDTAPVTFAGVPAGTIMPLRVQKVYQTGTAATSIIALR